MPWYINQQKTLAAEGNFWNTSKEWQVVLLTAFTRQLKVAALEKNIRKCIYTWLRRPTIAYCINNHKNPLMFWMVVCLIQSEKCYMKCREPLLRYWTPGPTTTLIPEVWMQTLISGLFYRQSHGTLSEKLWESVWEWVCSCWLEWKRNRMSGTVFFYQNVLVCRIFLHKCSNNIINHIV